MWGLMHGTTTMQLTETNEPLAIAMWDFSWLERRWPGGGYEDWDVALDELRERGYNAVRIDTYPHLVSADPDKMWQLPPNPMPSNDWGSPGTCDVRLYPELIEFIAKCRERDIQVGLSTWFREDKQNIRMNIESPEELGEIWVDTLDLVYDAGLMDAICYVDLCNEFPHSNWTPFLNPPEEKDPVARDSEDGTRWMTDSIEKVRESYPEMDYCLSFSTEFDTWQQQDVSAMDFLELHLWMSQFSDFNEELSVEPYDGGEYHEALAEHGDDLYHDDRATWKEAIDEAVDLGVAWSEETGKPIATTESWAVVFARDWPRLNWDWIRELCAYGVTQAASTGRWRAISTSNFCGPQFEGMWSATDWHRRMTDIIRSASIKV